MDRKIENCEKKATEEALECKRLDEELEQINEILLMRQKEKEDGLRNIEKALPFKHFFEKTVQAYEEFEGDTENIIKRENALRTSAKELEENNTRLQKRLETLRESWHMDQSRLQNEQLIVESMF